MVLTRSLSINPSPQPESRFLTSDPLWFCGARRAGHWFCLVPETRGHAKCERGEQLWCRWRPNAINYNGLGAPDEARRRLRRNICEENIRPSFTRASTFDEKPCAFLRILCPGAHTLIQKFVSCGGLVRWRQNGLM